MSLAITELAAFAERLADASGPIARGYFRSGLNIDIKADDSPVTRADRELEAHLREMIAAAYPEVLVVTGAIDPILNEKK